MTIPTNPSNLFSPFLPSTFNFPEEEDRDKEFIGTTFSQFSDVINDKKIGTFLQAAESFNGENWWYKSTHVNRNGYQAIAYIPSYPNAGVLVLTRTTDPQYPIPNVNNEFVITMLYGTASKPCSSIGAGDADFFQFNNQGDSRISFVMSDISITITTTVDLSMYSGFIVCSYLRNGL